MTMNRNYNLGLEELLKGLALAKYAVVSEVTSPTQFTAIDLSRYGDGYFASSGALPAWNIYVLRDTRSTSLVAAAPQGEQTATLTSTMGGVITHAAFTVPMVVGDEILMMHPNISSGVILGLAALLAAVNLVKTQTDKLAGVAPVSNAVVANWQAAEQNLVLVGAAATRNKVQSLMIDMNAIAGTLTIRMYHAVNGVQRQLYSQAFTVAVDGPGRWTINGTVGIFDVLRVTCQSNLVGDNGVAIAYSYMLEAM
jgi:ethanolamine ammonia-lyase large subunit